MSPTSSVHDNADGVEGGDGQHRSGKQLTGKTVFISAIHCSKQLLSMTATGKGRRSDSSSAATTTASDLSIESCTRVQKVNGITKSKVRHLVLRRVTSHVNSDSFWLTDRDIQSKEAPYCGLLIVVIPGNPAVVSLYREFAMLLVTKFPGAEVLVEGHAGHSQNSGRVFDTLQQQIDHHVRLLSRRIDPTKHERVLLLGHSIGAFILLNFIGKIRYNFPTVKFQVGLLAPTICRFSNYNRLRYGTRPTLSVLSWFRPILSGILALVPSSVPMRDAGNEICHGKFLRNIERMLSWELKDMPIEPSVEPLVKLEGAFIIHPTIDKYTNPQLRAKVQKVFMDNMPEGRGEVRTIEAHHNFLDEEDLPKMVNAIASCVKA